MEKEILYWTTANGKKIDVDRMDDAHVRNAFKMLLRKINIINKEIISYQKKDAAFKLRVAMERDIDSMEANAQCDSTEMDIY